MISCAQQWNEVWSKGLIPDAWLDYWDGEIIRWQHEKDYFDSLLDKSLSQLVELGIEIKFVEKEV